MTLILKIYEKMQEFARWLTDLQTMENRMVELLFTGVRNYHALRLHLEGVAKTCTRIDFPEASKCQY